MNLAVNPNWHRIDDTIIDCQQEGNNSLLHSVTYLYCNLMAFMLQLFASSIVCLYLEKI